MILEKHIFICTKCSYLQEDGKFSDPELSAKFRNDVKQAVKEQYPGRNIRVNASGCLGQCQKGINCVIYPQNEWLTHLRTGDIEKILKKI